MDDYADIYYVDTRNADIRDHRTNPGTSGTRATWPSASPPNRTVYAPVPSAPASRVYPAQYPASYPAPYATPAVPMMYGPYPQPLYPGAPMYPGAPPIASFFGKLTTGEVIEMVAQLFAALQPLPAAPVATREASTDIGNSILYQSALAQHAKRDEQVRTLGSLVSRLVG